MSKQKYEPHTTDGGPVEGAEPWVDPLIDAAYRFVSFFAMLEASRELDGEPPLEDNDVIISFMGNGASDALTARHFYALAKAIDWRGRYTN